jgi:DNA-binding CsgD family transcriptional regulator/tetratricopeptide (TPR) repeat protein
VVLAISLGRHEGDDVGTKATTDGLLGRDAEVATLGQALVRALGGAPQVVLVAGEAGIGKSALVAALVRRAHGLGARVGVGGCLDVSGYAPCGAIVEAMRQLGVDGLPAGTAPPDAWSHAVRSEAAGGPVVLVVEDIHWAERETRDALKTLALTAARERLLVVLTVRPEAVTPRHPARDLAVDLARAPGYLRLDLAPLDRDALSSLAQRELGTSLSAMELRELVLRSEGLPLFALELLSAGRAGLAGPTVPPRLADLFLARVESLPRPVVEVLRTASLTGTRIDEDLVAVAVEQTATSVVECLRVARDHHIVVAQQSHLQFRHALVRDAIYEDLLPGERRHLHARMAATLRARCAIDDAQGAAAGGADLATLGLLVDHAMACDDLETALIASVRAGLRWGQVGSVGREHLLRAVELWRRVERADQVTGMRHADLLAETASMLNHYDDGQRARELLREALDEVKEQDDSLLASRVHCVYARLGYFRDDPQVQESLRQSLRLAGQTPSSELARALAANGTHLLHWEKRPRAAADFLRRAVAVAVENGDQLAEAGYRGWLGTALACAGRAAEAEAEQTRAVTISEKHDEAHSALFFRQSIVDTLAMHTPRIPEAIERALATAHAARERHEPGIEYMALDCAFGIYLRRGELDRAEAMLTQMHDLGVEQEDWRVRDAAYRFTRGEVGKVSEQLVSEFDDDTAPDYVAYTLGVKVEDLLLRDDVATAAELVTAALSGEREDDIDPYPLAVIARSAYLVMREQRRTRVTTRQELSRTARAALDRLADSDQPPVSLIGLMEQTARAAAAHLDGQPRPDLWRGALDTANTLTYSLERLRLQPYAAEDLWATRDRPAARELLHQTWHEARDIGAGSVAMHTAAVARRRRIQLPDDVITGPGARLTPREREVLALLEAGATNRDIATRLFISEKTAGVHVSHVLSKLGVARRGQAAALARSEGP